MTMSYNNLFVPEERILINEEHTLQQLTGRFQSVRDGLPEIVKNSKDHYGRLGITQKNDRQILVLVSTDGVNLGVLDFGGATKGDFSGWKIWSDRVSNRREMSKDIEAGYGNGGKSFMVRGCLNKSSMCGYANGKVNKMGFVNNDSSLKYKAGVFKDDYYNELDDYNESDFVTFLNRELRLFGVNINDLPMPCQESLKNRKRFTLVVLEDVKDWHNKPNLIRDRLIKQIPDILMSHAQASLTLETSTVWVQYGKRLLSPEPLIVSALEPMQGLQTLLPIQIPQILEDPDTGEQVEVNPKNDNSNYLELNASRYNLRSKPQYKARNVIRVRNSRNIVANWGVAELALMTTSSYIYGNLYCNALDGELLTGSDRSEMVDNSLTRALRHWTTGYVKKLALEIQKLQASRNSEEDRSEASKTIDKLRELMKQHLELESIGGTGSGDSAGNHERFPHETGNRVDQIVLESEDSSITIATGTTIPLKIACFEINEGKKLPVRKPNLRLCVDSEGIIDHVAEYSIKGLAEGKVNVYIEDIENGKCSNIIEVIVIDINEFEIASVEKVLKQGERLKLNIHAVSKAGLPIQDMLYEAQVDEPEMGKIGRAGYFKAGGVSGFATIRFRYGSNDEQIVTTVVEVGEEKIEKHGGNRGDDIPYILMCGELAPGFGDYPEEQRTHPGGEDYPTIIDTDPVWDEKVIWINHNSVESIRVRTRKGGFSSITGTATKPFREFLALKCFEILKRLKVKMKVADGVRSYLEYLDEFSQAEMDTSGFLQTAYDYVDQMLYEDER